MQLRGARLSWCEVSYSDLSSNPGAQRLRSWIFTLRKKSRRFWFVCSIYWTRIISFANDCRKSDVCHCKTTRLWRTSSRRDTRLHSGKNGGRSQLAQNSKVRVFSSDVWIRLPRHKWSKHHGQTLKIQWYLLDENCTVTHSQALCGKDNFENVLLGLGFEKSTKLGMSFCSSKTRTILNGLCGWLEESRIWVPCGRNWWNWSILQYQHHFCPRIFGMDSTWMQTERNHFSAIPTFAFVHVISWPWESVDLVHERDVPSIMVTFRISAWWSKINFWVISNKFWSSSKFVFLKTSNFFNVIWSKMNGGFHCCRHEQSPDQYVGLPRFDTNDWWVICEIQPFLQVLEDFLKVSKIGDLHVVELQIRPSDLDVLTSLQFPGAGWACKLPLRKVSWCSKIECHLVASLENTLLGFGWCFASISCR